MDWMTARAAARRAGVGYSTFKQWIYQGSVRTTRTPGGHHRIASSEIDRILAAGGQPDRRALPRTAAAPPSIVALSTRNQLRGTIEEVRTDGLLAQVRLRVGDDLLTAIITKDAVTALGLRRGQPAIALIKSTEVMIACEPSARTPRLGRATSSRRRTRRHA